MAERKDFHGWNQTQVGAATGTLNACHPHGGFRSGAAAIFLRAVEAGALTARNLDLLGDGLVAGNSFLDGLNHTAFAALRIAGDHHFLGDDIIVASFHLTGLGAVAGISSGNAEHRAA